MYKLIPPLTATADQACPAIPLYNIEATMGRARPRPSRDRILLADAPPNAGGAALRWLGRPPSERADGETGAAPARIRASRAIHQTAGSTATTAAGCASARNPNARPVATANPVAGPSPSPPPKPWPAWSPPVPRPPRNDRTVSAVSQRQAAERNN